MILIRNTKPEKAIERAKNIGEIITSKQINTEYREKINKEKFNRYVPLERRKQVVESFIREASALNTTTVITECRDPDDNKFLELAVSSKASFIITGDQDLLSLHPFRRVAILTPEQFLKQTGE